MSGCSHFFNQVGCPHCAASRATTVREHAQAGNMLAGAQLNELNRMNAQMAQSNALAAQQTAVLTAQLDQQTRFQIATWLQTPDGKAYTAWEAGARVALHELDEADSFWRGAWYDAVAERAGADAMNPRRLPFGKLGHGALLLLALFVFNGFASGFLEAVSAVLFYAAVPGVVVMRILQAKVDRDAARRRKAVYGFDPLTGSVPEWSDVLPASTLRSALLAVLAAGPGAFPSAQNLPGLQLPPVRTTGWPAPLDEESANLDVVVRGGQTDVLEAVQRNTVA